MNLNTKQDKISFYKEKLQICNNVISMIPADDPYRDIKIQRMLHRIEIYERHLRKLKPEDLRGWS